MTLKHIWYQLVNYDLTTVIHYGTYAVYGIIVLVVALILFIIGGFILNVLGVFDERKYD